LRQDIKKTRNEHKAEEQRRIIQHFREHIQASKHRAKTVFHLPYLDFPLNPETKVQREDRVQFLPDGHIRLSRGGSYTVAEAEKEVI